MSRHVCHTCDALKEIYWIKAGQFVQATRSSRATSAGSNGDDDELQALKEDAMEALRTLLRHINACYGFNLETAA